MFVHVIVHSSVKWWFPAFNDIIIIYNMPFFNDNPLIAVDEWNEWITNVWKIHTTHREHRDSQGKTNQTRQTSTETPDSSALSWWCATKIHITNDTRECSQRSSVPGGNTVQLPWWRIPQWQLCVMKSTSYLCRRDQTVDSVWQWDSKPGIREIWGQTLLVLLYITLYKKNEPAAVRKARTLCPQNNPCPAGYFRQSRSYKSLH